MARVCWDGWPKLGCCLDRIGAIVCKNQALKILKVVPHTHKCRDRALGELFLAVVGSSFD